MVLGESIVTGLFGSGCRERELPSRAQGGGAAFGVTSSEVVSQGGMGANCRVAGDGEPAFFLLYLRCFLSHLFNFSTLGFCT